MNNARLPSAISVTSLAGNGASVTSVDAATVGGNTAQALRTYSEVVAANASFIDKGTLDNARLPSTIGISSPTVTAFVGNGALLTGISATNITAGILPAGRLDTTAGVQFGALGINTANGAQGTIRATGDITAFFSDERLKENLGRIDNALAKVKQIEGFRYRANDLAASFGYDQDKVHVGLSAQRVRDILPEVIDLAPFDSLYGEDKQPYSISGENYLTMHYDRVVALLVEAIKELDQKLEDHIASGRN